MVRADLAALADDRAALQDRARSDGAVATDRHACLHPDGARRQERDTPLGVALDDPALGDLLGRHQAGTVVHAESCVRVVGHVCGDCPASLADEWEHPGQVALALDELDLVEGLEEGLRVENVGPEVDLVHGQLLRGDAVGVLGLDNAVHVTRRVRTIHRNPRGRAGRW